MISTKKTEQIYNGLDVFKAIAAVMIVLLHTVETSDYFACGIKFIFTRFAVPFFFIVSGYFFGKGLNSAKDISKYFSRYEKKLIKIFFIWGIIIYGPFTILSYITNNESAGIMEIILLLIRRMLIIGAGPYWYLVALICSTVFIYLCYKGKKEWIIFVGMLLGFFLQISYTCFQDVLSEITVFRYLFKIIYVVYSWEFNFIMYGIPFVGIGYMFYKYDIRLSKKFSVIILIIATAMRVVEYNLFVWFPELTFLSDNTLSVAYIVQAVAYFSLGKEVDFKISKERSLLLRQWSSCIYFSHVIILYNILNPVLVWGLGGVIYQPQFIPMKMGIVLVVCTVFFTAIKKMNNRYLNVLING